MAQPGAEAKPAAGAGLLAPLLKASALALGLLVLGLAFRESGAGLLRRLHPDMAGAAIFVLAGGGLTALGAPRQVVAFAGGFVFGAWLGGALALAGQMVGCAANFYAARSVAGGWARRRLGGVAFENPRSSGGTSGDSRLSGGTSGNPRLSGGTSGNSRLSGGTSGNPRLSSAGGRILRLIGQSPFSATLTLRLLPAGSNLLLNLAAGVSGIAAAPFLAASLLGYVPQTMIFALLGSGAQLGHAAQMASAAAMFAASFALGGWLLWRQRAGV